MSNQTLIGIAQMRVSSDPTEILVAPNLGSCVALSVFDPVNRRGGLIHCLLPLSKSDPAKATQNPCTYVDTGVTALLDAILRSGVDKRKLVINVAGGANINDDNNVFEIGKRNHTVLKKILWKNSLLIHSEHVGDTVHRTLSLEVGTGRAYLKVRGETNEL